MFDLITGKAVHTPHTPAVPILVSTLAHVAVVGGLVVLPWMYVTDQLPEASTMMAFVTTPPPPPAPPPPPPAARPAAVRPEPEKPSPPTTAIVPTEPPAELVAELPAPDFGEEGVPDGVEGGIPGGVIGGIVVGVDIPPPPPPHEPLRVGGQLKEPAILHRVNPVYPGAAVAAHIEGIVILEAIVDREGRVEELRVLRGHPLLKKAAVEAVQQWRYSPVLLNGLPERFILTVTVSFTLEK